MHKKQEAFWHPENSQSEFSFFPMKKSISSIELAAIVNELQFLANGKIDQIYQPSPEELLLQLHVPGKGKQLLKILPGKWLCLTTKKETTIKPSNFSLQLRKYLDNSLIKALSQKDSERILVLELEKKELYFLVIELFSKGNIILTDSKEIIIAALEQRVWKDRTIKIGAKYVFPPASANWRTVTATELHSLFNKSQKRNLVTALATDVGLGGLYAEEICQRSKIEKNRLPSEISLQETKLVLAAIKKCLLLIIKPAGYVCDGEMSPFPLEGRPCDKQFLTYNEALNSTVPIISVSPYEQKIKSLERMVSLQEETIVALEQKKAEYTRKGESIYEHYAFILGLLEKVKEMRKDKDWQEIAAELKMEKRIKNINLKSKTMVLEF